MIKHGHIVVPTDFSACSGEALRRACVLAQRLGAEVHLLHVLGPVLAYEPEKISLSPVSEISAALRRDAETKLAEAAADSPAGVNIHTHLLETHEPPYQAICEFAANLPADLLVIGRHGHRGRIEQMLIGSTSERVVRHAPCSVLVTMPHGILKSMEVTQ